MVSPSIAIRASAPAGGPEQGRGPPGIHGDGSCGSDECGCEKGPMEVAIGEEQFFLQIEEALVGMAVGDKKTVTIPAEDAFGEYDADRVFTVERKQFPKDINPEVGQELELIAEDDESIGVTVVDANDESVTLDANHPLAGEELNYEFELVEIL